MPACLYTWQAFINTTEAEYKLIFLVINRTYKNCKKIFLPLARFKIESASRGKLAEQLMNFSRLSLVVMHLNYRRSIANMGSTKMVCRLL